MIVFDESMDRYSLDIRRILNSDDKPKAVGFLQWHPERQPRIIIRDSVQYLTLAELETCVAELRRRIEKQ